MENNNIIRGKVYILGDNIDTDQIIPAEYLNLVPTIPEEYEKLGSYAMAGLPLDAETFIPEGETKAPYQIIIAGTNFGCGSSREHAPIALSAAGIKAIVAESYARIFFRNSVSTGEVYPLESTEPLSSVLKNGDEIEIDMEKCELTNLAEKKTYSLKPIGDVAPVIAAGGIFAYAREQGMIEK
ncbi:MAG: 3-isopropylmalate dehydratase [Kiritimatiellae bacterium]|nr:3-isopropylmalate dehydratase [Kiritimatiellia bacterium]